ncbi:MAG: hypothetical protein WAX69_06100, partial [Victivallales bacterium]
MRKILMVMAISLAFCLSVKAQITLNTELRTVPAPGKVVIDGKLNDWDLSGEILMCYDLETLLNKYSSRAAAMYDKDYLYLSFRIKDPTPMLSHVNPGVQPTQSVGDGWRSDCVQLRLWADPEKGVGPEGGRVTHIDCWNYTDGGIPAANILHGSNLSSPEDKTFDAIGKGVDAAFIKDADGKGYTQEMRISWRLLRRDGRPCIAGENMRLGIQTCWGDSSAQNFFEHQFADLLNPERPQREFFGSSNNAWGILSFSGKGKLPPSDSIAKLSVFESLNKVRYSTSGPVKLEYSVPCDGSVTLVVEKPDGTRVRNLISDYPRKAGANTDYWDGADDNGRLVSPGDYIVRGLYHEEIDPVFRMAYGSPGNPPWDTSDGKGDWLPDHVPPLAAAADGERVYLSSEYSEGGSAIIAVGLDGQKQWGITRDASGMLATHGKYLYTLRGGRVPNHQLPGKISIARIDPAKGTYVPFTDKQSFKVISEFPNEHQIKPREPAGEAVEAHAYDAEWCQFETMGLASAGGKLHVSLFYQNAVIDIDPESGDVVGRHEIEKPVGLAQDKSGKLLVVTGKKIVRMDADGRTEPVVSEGLSAPIGLATDKAGNIYVSEWADQMCVKVFSPDGKFLRSIGKMGGRLLTGDYDPDGMFRPWGLAVDAQGRLWVAEHDYSPKRVSMWSAADGKFLREYCGQTAYASGEAAVNQFNPRQAFVSGNTVELDWATGRWRVTGYLWRPTRPGDLLGPSVRGLSSAGFPWPHFEFRERDGHKYLIFSETSAGYLCVNELDEKGRARPLMAIGHIKEFIGEGRLPDLVVKHLWDDPKDLEWARSKFPFAFVGSDENRVQYESFRKLEQESVARSRPMHAYFHWTDANGDGMVQETEIQFYSKEETGGVSRWIRSWQAAVSPDWSIHTNEDVAGKTTVWRTPLKKWNEAGAPVYDFKDAKLIVSEKYMGTFGFINTLWPDARGNLLVNHSPLQMFDPDGKLNWSYPNKWPGVHGSHSAPKDKRGLLIGSLMVLGSATVPELGEIFCMSGNMGRDFLMTTDGLYVASIFKDGRSAPDTLPDSERRGISVANMSAGGENFGGEFFRNALDNKVYIGSPISSARQTMMLCEMTGLDKIRRLPNMKVSLSEAQRLEAEKLLAERAAASDEKHEIAVRPLKQQATETPAIDWSPALVAKWEYDGRHAAEATWTFDDKNLHLAFRNVIDSTPMINGGKNIQTLFKTGDAVLFELRTK